MQSASNRERQSGAHWVQRPAERLVLDGYRHWAEHQARSACGILHTRPDLYQTALGRRVGRLAMAAWRDFVQALDLCAACPLRSMAAGSGGICADEVLIIGLVAGIQNGDQAATETCLRRLTCASGCETVALAAGNFALVLKSVGMTLQPVPVWRLGEIPDHTGQARVH